MQPLLVIAVLLQVMASEAQSGGGGENDDDAPPRGCVVQKGLNNTAELSWQTNLTTAVLRARCYSVCLSEQVIRSEPTGGKLYVPVPAMGSQHGSIRTGHSSSCLCA